MNAGTVQSQVKLQMLDMKWQKKKKDINQKSHENLSQEEIFMQTLEEQAKEVRKGRDTEQIYTKLKTGGTLTAEEISYLKENDPEALAEYEKAQAEKKAYEQALKNCRTKEEVDRLKMNRMGNFAAKAKSIANNPYIPKDKKLELMNRLNNEVCCIKDAHMEFTKSRAYKELPKESEMAEDIAEKRAAENDEILAEEMEAAEEISREANKEFSSASEEGNDTQENISNDPPKEYKPEISEKEFVESKDMSFDKLDQDIRRYLLKFSGKKSSFAAKV